MALLHSKRRITFVIFYGTVKLVIFSVWREGKWRLTFTLHTPLMYPRVSEIYRQCKQYFHRFVMPQGKMYFQS